ncbi:putative FAD binding domain-containing protein [Seiridium unicorne]|uniref:FAD binding domain-containing protein n=1 Tax=Seiridium unicorne TaxID=138068 RepID=A0ABR2V9D1_9PEZI
MATSHARVLVLTISLFFTSALSVCTNISAVVPGEVFLPNTSAYNSSLASYFFLGEQTQTPDYIIAPTSSSDVARVIKAIDSCACLVSVRSGGHSPNAGFSNGDSGITIDLRGNDEISLNEDASIVSVGSGALWIDVYKSLEPLNRTVVGARVADVGLGGFLTGGGLSFFSPRYGFGCDNVQNMEVVLANGSIVNANETSNPRLFRALKGGQNNFGIVTRFDLITHPQVPFWGGILQYPESADQDQMAAFAAFKMAPYDPYAEVEQTFVYFGALQSFSSTNNLFYTGPTKNTTLHYFLDIQPQTTNTLRTSTASDFAEEIKTLQPTDQFAVYATLSFQISEGVLEQVYELWKSQTSSVAVSIPNITSVLTFQSIPPPPAADASPNSLPFKPESTPQDNVVLLLLNFYWSDVADSAFIQDQMQFLTTSVQSLVGSDIEFKYLNYAASWQDPLAGYGKASVQELRETAQLYDPNGFFQKVIRGGFKLNNNF